MQHAAQHAAGRLERHHSLSGNLDGRLAGGLYVLAAEVDLPTGADVQALQDALHGRGEELGVGVGLRQVESDEL